MESFFKKSIYYPLPKNDLHYYACKSVLEYAYTEDSNPKYRQYMEDTFCHHDRILSKGKCGLFGIFDGHGGKYTSQFCCEEFPKEVKKLVK